MKKCDKGNEKCKIPFSKPVVQSLKRYVVSLVYKNPDGTVFNVLFDTKALSGNEALGESMCSQKKDNPDACLLTHLVIEV